MHTPTLNQSQTQLDRPWQEGRILRRFTQKFSWATLSLLILGHWGGSPVAHALDANCSLPPIKISGIPAKEAGRKFYIVWLNIKPGTTAFSLNPNYVFNQRDLTVLGEERFQVGPADSSSTIQIALKEIEFSNRAGNICENFLLFFPKSNFQYELATDIIQSHIPGFPNNLALKLNHSDGWISEFTWIRLPLPSRNGALQKTPIQLPWSGFNRMGSSSNDE